MKHRLTQDQEFQILKMVLNVFLWLGVIVMLFGGWQIIQGQLNSGITWIAAGAVVLVLFIVLILKHYEVTP